MCRKVSCLVLDVFSQCFTLRLCQYDGFSFVSDGPILSYSITSLNHFLNSLWQVQDLLKDPCFDKLSVVAMETIMMSHICFPHNPDDYEQVTTHAYLQYIRAEFSIIAFINTVF